MSHGPCGLGGAPLAPVADCCAIASVVPISMIASARIIAALILIFIVDPFRVAKINSGVSTPQLRMFMQMHSWTRRQVQSERSESRLADELVYRFFKGDQRGCPSFEEPRSK